MKAVLGLLLLILPPTLSYGGAEPPSPVVPEVNPLIKQQQYLLSQQQLQLQQQQLLQRLLLQQQLILAQLLQQKLLLNQVLQQQIAASEAAAKAAVKTPKTGAPPPTCNGLTSTQSTLFITCDNILLLYVDGFGVTSPHNDADWRKTSSTLLPAGTRSVAVSCQDLHHQEGILASTTNGALTDSSWKCSSSSPNGWEQPDFDDSSWAAAEEIANHGDSPWKTRPGINPNAKWIWTSGTPRGDTTVYCRRTFPCNVDK